MRASVFTILASFLFVGCSDNRTANVENDAAVDQSVTIDVAADIPEPEPAPDVFVMPDFDPEAPTYDFVFDRLLVPGDGAQYGADLDGDGVIDNALGGLLSAVSGLMGGGDIQGMVDQSVYAGEALMLMRLYADDIANDPTVPGDLWYADPTPCCADPANITACRSEADTTCFSGTHTFTAVPPATKLGGSIVDDKINIGVPKLALPLPVIGNAISISLSYVKLTGTITSAGIEDGIVAGAITQEEIENKILPAVSMALDQAYQGGVQELGMFDIDKDGVIDFDEVANNPLVVGFFTGDVDIDGDGVKELSLGMGFTAVNASIELP